MSQCVKCPADATQWWPAFDRTVPPAPYCTPHYEKAKRTTVLEGPALMKMAGISRSISPQPAAAGVAVLVPSTESINQALDTSASTTPEARCA